MWVERDLTATPRRFWMVISLCVIIRALEDEPDRLRASLATVAVVVLAVLAYHTSELQYTATIGRYDASIYNPHL